MVQESINIGSVGSEVYPDLTEILNKYCEWDYIVRNKYLRYAAALITQHHRVVFREIEYHHIEDLKVDLDAECYLSEPETE